MNPRIKSKSTELIMQLAEKYHDGVTGSILPKIVAPFVTSKIQSIPWKFIKARMDLALDFLKLYGLEDAKTSSNSGWTSEVNIFHGHWVAHLFNS